MFIIDIEENMGVKRNSRIVGAKGAEIDKNDRENVMKAKDQVFIKYEAESGQVYYCTINAVAENNIVSEWEIDSCKEASSDRRYSRMPNFVDRNE